MERLGFWGIIKLTTHIILRNLQHFLCIALLLALPYAFSCTVLGPPGKAFQNLAASMGLLYRLRSAPNRAGGLNPSDLAAAEESLVVKQQQYNQPPFSLLITVFIVSAVISFLCIPLVTFSVCRACLNKNLDLKGSLRGVLRSLKNLVLTVLVMVGVIILFELLAMLGIAIIAAGISAVKVSAVVPVVIVMSIGVQGGGLCYMAVMFSLAYPVAILEEKKGWEALSKSSFLIQGSRWIVVGLYVLFKILRVILSILLTASDDASVVWRWGAGGMNVCVQAVLSLFTLASMVVLYMSCKSGHREPLDTLLAASTQFDPHQLASAKYLDLETAGLYTTSDKL